MWLTGIIDGKIKAMEDKAIKLRVKVNQNRNFNAITKVSLLSLNTVRFKFNSVSQRRIRRTRINAGESGEMVPAFRRGEGRKLWRHGHLPAVEGEESQSELAVT